jgi:integrase
VSAGKTPAARRNVPLTPRARAVLEMRAAAKDESTFVFPGPGKTGHITSIQHAHERTIKRANQKARKQGLKKNAIEPFEFYCWRHTFGTRCAEAGMDKYAIARLMGHSSPSVAERFYIKVSRQYVERSFERFLEYQAREQMRAFPESSERVQ